MTVAAAVGLLCTFVGLFTIYFVVGTLVRYRSGLRHCPEVLPNYTFWRRVWASLRDGCRIIFTCGRYQPTPTVPDASVLPSKPHRRDFGFEELPDEGDEYEYDYDGSVAQHQTLAATGDAVGVPGVTVRY